MLQPPPPADATPAGPDVLSVSHPSTDLVCGDFVACYRLDARTGHVGFRLLPLEKRAAEVAPRTVLDTVEILALPADAQASVRPWHGEASLVQLKLREDAYGGAFGHGRSMRLNPTVEGLKFVRQEVARPVDASGAGWRVRTVLAGGARAFRCTHVLAYRAEAQAVTVCTEFENVGDQPLTLEMLSSFVIGHLSPFDAQDSAERLRLHRFRSLWSAEGRHEVRDLEDLHLERSWANVSVVNERFGQVGSLPVRGWFPFAAVEDVRENVFWAVQLAAPGSWQIELYRRDDKLSVSGGLADREFGHWMKTVAPGETFISPAAWLTAAAGPFDAVCQRLVRMHEPALNAQPALERELPVIFNEWCSSWGHPTPAFIERTAARLQDTPTRIFVIDDGWAEKPDGMWQFNGDWNVEHRRFPDGLAPVATALRARGFVPGLWFEFEVCTEGSRAFGLPDHKLRRDGRLLQVGARHFWDFSDPWTSDYLAGKVIARLRDDGFSYLKVDYNDSIGLGCDHPDSLGEGLRAHLEGVQRFFRRLRAELPDLIIEICSSGGHRLEPSFLELGAMGSFSDAHESPDIPIIAANLHRLIHPRQNQIWAVLHAGDSLTRLHYSLAACHLGRVALSGEIERLPEQLFAWLNVTLGFYERSKHLVRDGESHLHRAMNRSWRHPRGWQAVVRTARPRVDEALVVVHAFGAAAGTRALVPLPPGRWEPIEELATDSRAHLSAAGLELEFSVDFCAHLLRLRAVV